MRTLEVVRHSLTRKGPDRSKASHLSPEGVRHAIPDGGTALVVSSGGSIEPVLVAAFPDADHAEWVGPLHQLEGVTIRFDGDRFTAVALRRRPPA